MAINTNFDILEPQAWVELARELPYPMKPLMSLAATSVAGNNLEGFVSQKNKTVKVPRPVRIPKSEVRNYDASSITKTTVDVNNADLVIDQHKITQFDINKRDEKFSLPELVSMYFRPFLDAHAQSINDYMWTQASKFQGAFYDANSASATVLDDEDVRFARKTLLKRKFVNPQDGFVAVLDPDADDDLGSLSIFQQADSRGDSLIQREGSMGRFAGFDFFMDNIGSSYSAASVDTGDRVAGAASEGALTVTIDDGAGSAPASTLDEGDLIYFASANGRDEIYTVHAFNDTTGVITLKEPLRANVGDNALIVAVPAGQVQLFYNPASLALVTAGMESVSSSSSIQRAIGFDPANNMNYTLSIEETVHGATVTIETLYGAQNFYEDYGIRYIRGTAAKA